MLLPIGTSRKVNSYSLKTDFSNADMGLKFTISSETAKRFLDNYLWISLSEQFVLVNHQQPENRKKREREFFYNGQESSDTAVRYLSRLQKLWNVSGKEKESIELCNIVLGLDKGSHLAYFYRAYARSRLKNYIGAISDYTKAIKIKSDDSLYYFNRAIVKRDLEDYNGAISDYTKAIKIKPNDTQAYINRGIVKRQIEDYMGAISDYTKAIKIKPNQAEAYANRGLAKAWLNDLDGACSDLRKAASLGLKEFSKWIMNQCGANNLYS